MYISIIYFLPLFLQNYHLLPLTCIAKLSQYKTSLRLLCLKSPRIHFPHHPLSVATEQPLIRHIFCVYQCQPPNELNMNAHKVEDYFKIYIHVNRQWLIQLLNQYIIW
jgi:hypothetical protein